MNNIHINDTPTLIKEALINGEVYLTEPGSVLAYTGKFTGRAAQDKYIVLDDLTRSTVDWDSNKAMNPDAFDSLYRKVLRYLDEHEVFYGQELYAGVNQELKFRFIGTTAWHCLFARTMFYPTQFDSSEKGLWTLIHAPNYTADPSVDETRSEAFIILNFTKKIILIGGTSYAGEIKKSVFTVLNFLLPEQGVLPMHSSVNVSTNGKSTVFFGLSGTGKTTLSADPNRILVGDDEHGWSNDGLFNFEDGCYAKAINLSKENEPEIWGAVNSFGTVLENVKLSNDGALDFADGCITENTRAAYKLNRIPNASKTRTAEHPSRIVMLTCDAYGILPPAALLSPEQAVYYFLSGYTAKIAGTEAGIKEPTATFSTCFGAPFLPRHPTEYAELLLDKIKKHNVEVWLVNTGWVGGPYGVGNRISLAATRKIINRILDSALSEDMYSLHIDPNFGFTVPVGAEFVLNQWSDNSEYQKAADKLVDKFKNNFKKYESSVSADIMAAGPL